MPKTIFLAVVFFLSLLSLQGQVVLKGRIQNLPPSVQQVAIDYWLEDRWAELGRMDLAADGSFQKNVAGSLGQARLRLWGEPTHWVDFVMPKTPTNDSILDFGVIDYAYLDGNPAKLKGKENEAYYLLLTEHKKYRLLRDSLARNDSLPAEAKADLENQIEIAKSRSNAQCKKVLAENKGSFTGDIVANLLYVPVKSDYPGDENIAKLNKKDFERECLLDRLPLGDRRVLLHNGLIRALNQYSTKFLESDSSNYIIKIMGKRRGNEEVDTWLFKYLLQVSVGFKSDNTISYLVKWYSTGCSNEELNVDQATKILLTSLKNCEIGKRAFNLTLPDATGKTFRLADLASKSKMTFLLFWRSDCSHCKEFEPELEELYKRYKPLGLEVIGISLDQFEANWRNYIAANPVSWKNLYPSTRDLRIQLITNFPIPGTPALIAVDKDFKVKNRMVIRNDIEKYIKDELEN